MVSGNTYKAPETVHNFGLLMLKKKIMTHDVMLRHKMHCNPPTCVQIGRAHV